MTASNITAKPDWQAIRLAAVRGVFDPTLAEAFGVTREAIRQRRKREQWPGAVLKENVLSTERQRRATSGQQAEAVILESLAEIGERNANLIATHVSKLILKALPAMKAPESWSDLSTANKMVETSTGRTRKGAAVSNTINWWGNHPTGRVIDLE